MQGFKHSRSPIHTIYDNHASIESNNDAAFDSVESNIDASIASTTNAIIISFHDALPGVRKAIPLTATLALSYDR